SIWPRSAPSGARRDHLAPAEVESGRCQSLHEAKLSHYAPAQPGAPAHVECWNERGEGTMAETRNAPTTPPAAGWPVGAAGIAAAAGVLRRAFVGRYGYFRDEFYYLACGRRLDWGYVDHPPFVALVARFAHGLFGDSFLAIRILPILAGSLTILLTGLLARELGGGRYAQTLAALCAAVAPHYLFVFHILSMNAFEVLLWTAPALIAARLLNGGDPRLWLLFGALCGVGLENKHSMAFFGIGV